MHQREALSMKGSMRSTHRFPRDWTHSRSIRSARARVLQDATQRQATCSGSLRPRRGHQLPPDGMRIETNGSKSLRDCLVSIDQLQSRFNTSLCLYTITCERRSDTFARIDRSAAASPQPTIDPLAPPPFSLWQGPQCNAMCRPFSGMK